MKQYPFQTYSKKEVITFAKVDGPFGLLHNMAPGCPIHVLGQQIKTSEHLYQAMRFPDYPEIQAEILNQASPMTAKIKMKEHIELTRPDWDEIKVSIMGWCLLMKLAQNWEKFGSLLVSTRTRSLVEYSKKDDFWGAMPAQDQLVGANVLGQLLMRLREKIPQAMGKKVPIKLPKVPNLRLLGEPLQDEWTPLLLPFPVKTTVVNRYHNAPYDQYIGRGTKWGNPFSHLEGTTAKFKVATREEAVSSYEKWIMEPEQQYLRDDIHELEGKILGCSCHPLACHGHVLARLANQNYQRKNNQI